MPGTNPARATAFLGKRANEGWQKVDDILDVWFDSGSTHAFVLEDPQHFPALAHIKRKADSRSRGLAVLAVEERQVHVRPPGERERPAILRDTRANGRGRFARAREPVPPAEHPGGGLAREDVHHEHLVGAGRRCHTTAPRHRSGVRG